jgi:archaellin
MTTQEATEIGFSTAGIIDATKNTKVTIEIRPAVGAALPFSRSMPPTILTANVLY